LTKTEKKEFRKDYGVESTCWRSEEQCEGAPDAIAAYWKRRKIIDAYDELRKSDEDLLVVAGFVS